MENLYIPSTEIEKQNEIAGELRKLCSVKKAAVQTYGFQQNEADSERIGGTL